MEAVLLAGGFGTRLLPLTRTRPKVMVPLLNKPMIDHVVDALPPSVDRVLFAVGYKHEDIQAHFEEKNDREYLFFTEDKPLGTGGAIKNCEEGINDTFMVLNADGLTSVDISSLIDLHKTKQAMATVSLWEVDNPEPYGIVDMEDDGKLKAFVEKPKRSEAPSRLANAGIYVLEREVLDMIAPDTFVSIEKEIFPQIIPHGFYGLPFEGYYLDAGNLHAYLVTQHHLLSTRGRNTMLGSATVTRGRLGENVCLGSMVELAANTTVANSAVLNSVTVDEGSNIDSSIIGDGCTIGKGVRISECILGDDVIVEDGAILQGARIEPGEKVSGA